MIVNGWNFRVAITCPNCGADIIKESYNLSDDIVYLSFFACEEWECEKCGCICLTGDEDSMMEVDDSNCSEEKPSGYRWCSCVNMFCSDMDDEDDEAAALVNPDCDGCCSECEFCEYIK